MFWLGILVVVLTFVAIVKRYEARLVLFLSGLLLTILSGNWSSAFDAFTAAMINKGLVPVICSVMGFAYVMKLTQCDAHLVNLLAGLLKRWRVVLIPGTVVVTFIVNIALPTAAGCAAAVGIVLIPTLIKAGIHPVIAASAVLAGTWGSVLNPGTVHNPFIAKLAGMDVMAVISGHFVAAMVGLAVVAVSLTAIAIFFKEDRGYETVEATVSNSDPEFKVNIIKAIIPVLPLTMLILGSKQIHLIPEVSVLQAMIIGVMIGFAVTLKSPQEISKQFFAGMGDSFGSVVGLIIAASVFISGLDSMGIVKVLIEAMKGSQSIAKLAAAWGPFLVTVLSGSGDAATLAFNGAITPHANDFGLGISQTGSLAYLSGGLGRSMSPVAPVTIICATLAGVSPIDMVKRNALGVILAAFAVMLIL
jgi:DcuC family C4-dicarboxylate transporter